MSRYAGVLAFHGDQVVLVREEYPTWGGAIWNVPSGRVEDGEIRPRVLPASWLRRRVSS